MYLQILKVFILSIWATGVLARPTIYCKKPKADFPTGVQEAIKSTVTTFNAVALTKGDLDDEANAITSVGSGVILDTEGHVVITGHSIAKYLRMEGYPKKHIVYLHDCSEYEASVIAIGGDEKEGVDAVILKINNPPKDLVPIKRGLVSYTEKNVYAIGSPYGWTNTVNEGVLAGPLLNRTLDETYAHVDLKDGMSGGPLVTESGTIVGIAQGKKLISFGGADIYVSFFVPIARINYLVRKEVGFN